MRIGVDIDGTLADNLRAFVTAFNKVTGKNLTTDDIYDFDLSLVYGITPQEVEQVFHDHAERVFARVPVMAGARNVLTKLKKAGVEIFVVTARNPKFRELTTAWLEKNRLPVDHLIFEGDKGLACELFGLELFIDDNLDNALRVKNAGAVSLLMDAPYNRNVDPAIYGIKRIVRWPEMLAVAETLIRKRLSA